MFVCICNAICDRRVGEAIDTGCSTADEVYSACGAEPKCRTCSDMIETMIEERALQGRFVPDSPVITAAAAAE